ncbi:MAG: hypothetical protein QW478_00415 [Candidatus Micrarchaeaceae archaeon]
MESKIITILYKELPVSYKDTELYVDLSNMEYGDCKVIKVLTQDGKKNIIFRKSNNFSVSCQGGKLTDIINNQNINNILLNYCQDKGKITHSGADMDFDTESESESSSITYENLVSKNSKPYKNIKSQKINIQDIKGKKNVISKELNVQENKDNFKQQTINPNTEIDYNSQKKKNTEIINNLSDDNSSLDFNIGYSKKGTWIKPLQVKGDPLVKDDPQVKNEPLIKTLKQGKTDIVIKPLQTKSDSKTKLQTQSVSQVQTMSQTQNVPQTQTVSQTKTISQTQNVPQTQTVSQTQNMAQKIVKLEAETKVDDIKSESNGKLTKLSIYKLGNWKSDDPQNLFDAKNGVLTVPFDSLIEITANISYELPSNYNSIPIIFVIKNLDTEPNILYSTCTNISKDGMALPIGEIKFTIKRLFKKNDKVQILCKCDSNAFKILSEKTTCLYKSISK